LTFAAAGTPAAKTFRILVSHFSRRVVLGVRNLMAIPSSVR
jgi:hypothetical protein